MKRIQVAMVGYAALSDIGWLEIYRRFGAFWTNHNLCSEKSLFLIKNFNSFVKRWQTLQRIEINSISSKTYWNEKENILVDIVFAKTPQTSSLSVWRHKGPSKAINGDIVFMSPIAMPFTICRPFQWNMKHLFSARERNWTRPITHPIWSVRALDNHLYPLWTLHHTTKQILDNWSRTNEN